MQGYGVTPFIFDVSGDHWLTVYYNGNTGLKLGELLYTPRGSQGGITSTYIATRCQVDPTNSKYNYPSTNLFLFTYTNYE
jgi:hypothetical protein